MLGFIPNEFFPPCDLYLLVQFLHTAGPGFPLASSRLYCAQPKRTRLQCLWRVQHRQLQILSIPVCSWNREVEYEWRLMMKTNADMNADSKTLRVFLLRHLKLKLLGFVAERFIPTKE